LLDLSAVAILEKNKIASTGAWLVLLEIRVNPDIVIRVVHNNEDITWNGEQWIGFPFELDDVLEDSKELPRVTLKVSNITGIIQQYLEETQGGVGASVILRVVHSEHLDQTKPEIEETFSVQSTSTDAQWVTFELSGDFTTSLRIPPDRYLKDFCPYKFKSLKCGYQGDSSACNKTLDDCRAKSNAERFGGEPALPGGIYVSNP
jgi:lambda family phage minor tail protein L